MDKVRKSMTPKGTKASRGLPETHRHKSTKKPSEVETGGRAKPSVG